MIYSGIPHPTASVFLSGSFIEAHERVHIITDDIRIYEFIAEAGSWIWGKRVRMLSHVGELFTLGENDDVSVIHTKLLKGEGNLEHIRRTHTIEIQRGTTLPHHILIEQLLERGYHQSDYAGESGTYRRSGALIHIYYEDREYMIEYFDDEVESIIESSRDSRIHRDRIILASLIPYVPVESENLSEALMGLLYDTPTLLLGCEFLKEREIFLARIRDKVEFSSLTRDTSHHLDITPIEIESLPGFLEYRADMRNQGAIAITRYRDKLEEFQGQNPGLHMEVIEHKHIRESFRIEGMTELLGTRWGAYSGDSVWSLLSDDIWNELFVQNRIRKSTIKHLDLLLKVQPRDLVVHREHGIGRYINILKKRIGLIEREYMEIEYRGGDKVYVPMTELARITKYIGESETELSSLDGVAWEKTLSKTDEEIQAIAEEILETDAKRTVTTRIPFGHFPSEERVFREAFAYTHTTDQRAIIDEIYADMMSPHPMDRLVAGDVGFGKTEIAMNAAYKAVLSGVQVAVISPLLILAEEHRETFEERLGAWGVRIRSLTRMTSAREAERILEEMRIGNIDIIIGTHRLLSEDVRFRRLGLLIIDEEHRFGVGQKETIKKMKAHIDILSLSATPIPRSLHMALSGLKKISLLTTPPPSKKPIQTIVARWDRDNIRRAITRELARSGQIIILHNRVRSLPIIEREIRELLEDEGENVRIIMTHGQMPPHDIEDRILGFKQHKYDILLTTTIIENGVNFLEANTIIVSDAEEFGLAQLHQIRGRVGRKDVPGICYLLYRKYELSSEERERLMILAEHSALGSGYEIAMRDMQMRGTGDILGYRQSGKSKEVGISLYFQLLEEKVSLLKNGKKEQSLTKIDLDISYVIADSAFDSEMDKLSFFRDIESIGTLEELEYAESTFVKSSGAGEDTPDTQSLSNLFLMMRTAIIMRGYGVDRISKMGNNYHFDFIDGTTPNILRGFLDRFDTSHDMIIVSVTKIKIDTKVFRDAVDFLVRLTR